MKTLKVWFMMALCALVAGCTADENWDSGDSQTIVLRIGSADTKAVGEPGKGTDKATLKNGYIFFANQVGAIKRCYKLLEKGATNLDNLEILVTDITDEGGMTFDNVPGDVSQVYILANIPDENETAEANVRGKTTLNGVKGINIPVAVQNDFAHVTMDGLGQVQNGSAGHENEKTVTVNLKVFCSRLEIPKLTASGDITSYKIKAIYVSHFYKQVPLDETVDAAQLYKFTTAGKGDYTSTYPMLADVAEGDGLGHLSDLVTTPEESPSEKVWGYQFIPGKDGKDREGIRVVIELSDVTGTTGTYTGTQYLNIRGLVANNAGPGAKPMSLERGKIYSMGANLSFDEGNITPTPNPDDIGLTVKITVEPWTVETVKPVL